MLKLLLECFTKCFTKCFTVAVYTQLEVGTQRPFQDTEEGVSFSYLLVSSVSNTKAIKYSKTLSTLIFFAMFCLHCVFF